MLLLVVEPEHEPLPLGPGKALFHPVVAGKELGRVRGIDLAHELLAVRIPFSPHHG
jgi:hypothetical protein